MTAGQSLGHKRYGPTINFDVNNGSGRYHSAAAYLQHSVLAASIAEQLAVSSSAQDRH